MYPGRLRDILIRGLRSAHLFASDTAGRRLLLPISMKGCGLRSAPTTAVTAWLACLRCVASFLGDLNAEHKQVLNNITSSSAGLASALLSMHAFPSLNLRANW